MRWRGVAAAVAVSVGTAVAQQGRDPAAELARMQREKERVAGEIAALVERRFRHDLGLPAEPDPTSRHVAPVSTAEKERLIDELREQEGTTAAYLSRFNEVRAALEALRADVAARTAASEHEDQYVVVPSPGAMQRATAPPRAADAVESPPVPEPSSAPHAVVLPLGQGEAIRLDRVSGHIQGSRDHLAVARSLYRAGQSLMDAAATVRGQDAAAAARELDDRGKARLERALAELEPLLAGPEPPYAALFCRGRCLELLFRYSERYEELSLQRQTRLYQQREQEVREPFLAIAARDVTKAEHAGAVEVPGAWGKAAQAAVEHFRWMNLHADYRPSTPIESLTWAGEKAR